LGGPCRDGPSSDNDVDPEPDHLGRILPEPLDVARTPPVLHAEGLTLDIPQLAETLHDALTGGGVGTGARPEGEIRDPRDGPWPLRFGGEWHREDSEGEGDEALDGAAPRGGRLPLASCMPVMTMHTADWHAHDPLLAARDTILLFAPVLRRKPNNLLSDKYVVISNIAGYYA
jgi:hypothetical protein